MNGDHVPLKKYLETRLADLEKRLGVQRKADRKQLMLIIKHQARALRLQAKEYERRLTTLNHAHEEAVRVLNTYALAKDFNELKGRVDIEFADRGGRTKGVISLFTVSSGLALIISVTVAILTYVK